MSQLLAASGDINNIIGGLAPDWGPFGKLGAEARVMVEVIMAVAVLVCLGIAVWGAAKQRRRSDRRVHHRVTRDDLYDCLRDGHLDHAGYKVIVGSPQVPQLTSEFAGAGGDECLSGRWSLRSVGCRFADTVRCGAGGHALASRRGGTLASRTVHSGLAPPRA